MRESNKKRNSHPRVERENFEKAVSKNLAPQISSSVLCTMLIDFHDVLGPTIQHAFPQEIGNYLQLSTAEQPFVSGPWGYCPQVTSRGVPTEDWIKELCRVIFFVPFLALPDASHHHQKSSNFFLLPTRLGPIFGASALRRIGSSDAPQFASSRGFVQKAACVLSTTPSWNAMIGQMDIMIDSYFKVSDLSSFSVRLNKLIEMKLPAAHPDTYLAGVPEDILRHLFASSLVSTKIVFKTLKAILAELKTLVISDHASHAAAFILCVSALIPAVSYFGHFNEEIKLCNSQLHKSGQPLSLPNSNFPIQPHLSLQLVEGLSGCSGYLIGATNSVITSLLSPEVIIDLRKDSAGISYSNSSVHSLLSRTDQEKRGIEKSLKNALASPTPTDNATQFFLDLFQKKPKNHKFLDPSALLESEEEGENSETASRDLYVGKSQKFSLEVAGLIFSEHLDIFLVEIRKRIEPSRDLSLLKTVASDVAQATGWSKKFTRKFCEGNLCSIWARKILQP